MRELAYMRYYGKITGEAIREHGGQDGNAGDAPNRFTREIFHIQGVGVTNELNTACPESLSEARQRAWRVPCKGTKTASPPGIVQFGSSRK